MATDIFCVHDYEQNPEIFKEHYDKLMTEGTLFDNHAHRQTYKGEATFVSEYGGIQWSQDENGWGYGTGPKTEEEFLTRFKGLTDALLDNSEMVRSLLHAADRRGAGTERPLHLSEKAEV